MNRAQKRLNKRHVLGTFNNCIVHFPQRALLLRLSLPLVICTIFCLIREIIESIPHHLTVPLPWDAALTGYIHIFIHSSSYCDSLILAALAAAQSQQYGLLECLVFWTTRFLLRNHPYKQTPVKIWCFNFLPPQIFTCFYTLSHATTNPVLYL